MTETKTWGMPLKITGSDFSRQASFSRQWDAYKKAFIDSFIKEKENKEMSNSNYTYGMPTVDKMSQKKDLYFIPGITKVIYNPPATIIYWSDKTKTVVKCCENDIYDSEKGFAMAVIKKLCGNDSALFHKLFKTWVLESKDAPEVNIPPINIGIDLGDALNDMIRRVFGVGGSDGN